MQVEGLVSTIIPVHNRPELLVEAVKSVLAQTYRPIEVIIVDDGSTDETGQVAEELRLAHGDEILVLHIPNGGPGVAREAGRQIARGEFIQYLDSDDLLFPTKFEMQVGGLRQQPDSGVAYGKTRFYLVADAPHDVPWKRTGERMPTMFPSFLQSRWWDTSTPLYRRSVTDRAGPWSTLRNEEDWEYDCRVASQQIRLHYCDDFVSDTRVAPGSQLSADGSTDPDKLRDRAIAHKLMHAHAAKANIDHRVSEMQHFARELFLLSRQCGAAGLSCESKRLFQLAKEASGPVRSSGLDFRAYATAARLMGWTTVGRLACRLDGLRP